MSKKEIDKKYEMSEKGKQTRKKYEQTEKCKEYRHLYNQSEIRKESQSKRRTTECWREDHRRRIKEACESNVSVKLAYRLRTRIWHALNGKGAKSSRTMELIGCSVEFLKTHLEKKFLPGMTWENYGKGSGKWNMDHIRPCASFDLADPEEQKKCFHYENLQPLWESDNIRKKTNYEKMS